MRNKKRNMAEHIALLYIELRVSIIPMTPKIAWDGNLHTATTLQTSIAVLVPLHRNPAGTLQTLLSFKGYGRHLIGLVANESLGSPFFVGKDKTTSSNQTNFLTADKSHGLQQESFPNRFNKKEAQGSQIAKVGPCNQTVLQPNPPADKGCPMSKPNRSSITYICTS